MESLQELGLQVFASDCPPDISEEGRGVPKTPEQVEGFGWTREKGHVFDAKPISELSYDADRGVAIVFGSESRGVSSQFITHSDGAFYLPMCGLTQSFNISVAAAMSLYGLIATGNFPEGSLPEEERAKLLALWLLRDVKAAKPILKQAGVDISDF